ncbi:MAG: Uma2 family endonuclease [Bryobacterales bacterium]|nr:Uma2 family endonuclease [Bryobacterales bacterium]
MLRACLPRPPRSYPEPTSAPVPVREEEYPCSDGLVLMETEPHADAIVAMRNQLQAHFSTRPDVYVAGSMAVYYRQGDPSAVLVPDLFVVKGAPRKPARKSYRLWDEGGVAPSFVVDVASPSTSERDASVKRLAYERMGVGEYWRFDPTGTLIAEGLVGWRLRGGRYQRARATGLANGYRSVALGLDLRAEGPLLRFWDTRRGRSLPTHAEASRALEQNQKQLDRTERKLDATERKLGQAVRERDQAEREREQETRGRERAERKLDEAQQRIRELQSLLGLAGKSG